MGRDCTGNFIPNALGFLHADSSLSSPKSSQLWKGYVSVTDIASGQEVAGESHGGLSRTVKTWSHRNQVVGITGNECRSFPGVSNRVRREGADTPTRLPERSLQVQRKGGARGKLHEVSGEDS